MKLKKYIESKVRINKANGQINLNPSIKSLPKSTKELMRKDPSSVRALIRFVKVKDGR